MGRLRVIKQYPHVVSSGAISLSVPMYVVWLFITLRSNNYL